MPTPETDLGAAELEVLRTLWDEGPATVREVMNLLHRRGRKVAYTTVLTFLSRLEAKRFVASDRSGLAYVYRPTITREKVTSSRLRQLLEQLYDVLAGPLVLQLVREQQFTSDEIATLQRLVDRFDGSADRPFRRSGKEGSQP